ncbi:MAG: hypothetical protein GC185_13465 [Alphaproteobacteria bacterium]|nr:hypothetical protein [Alphaproteobacteria bacterium]
MGKLWSRKKDDAGKAQLVEADLSALTVTRPTVIYVSGFLTNNNRPGFIAGGIKQTEALLEGRLNDGGSPDVYAWSHTSLANLFNLAAYNMFPGRRASKAGYELGAGVLMPLVAKDFTRDKKGKVSGTPLPPEEARAKLRNVTFFGYSAGSIVAQETFNATLKMMKGIGYDEKDARGLLKEVALLSVGTISRPSKEVDRFSTVYLVASNDRINRMKNWIWGTMGTALRTVFTRYGWKKDKKELSVRPLSKSSLFLSAAVRPTLYEWKYDEDGQRKEKKWFQPLYPKWLLRRSYHELPHYITTDDNNNPFSRIALYTLTNAVNRTSTPDPAELVKPPAQDIHDEEAKAAYADKIERAKRPSPAGLNGVPKKSLF